MAHPTRTKRSPKPKRSSAPTLRERVRAVPQSPGVYRWKDARGRVLYIGKAKNLKRRMQSYLRDSAKLENFRKRGLTERMADFDVTVTDTELEALILEMHLIRGAKPTYNVALTRDAHYVFVRIGENEAFPSIRIVTAKEDDGARYLGPFTNTWSQESMLRLLRTLFPFRTCVMSLEIDPQPTLFERIADSDERLAPKEGPRATRYPLPATRSPSTIPLQIITKHKDRRLPCLDYHIKQCAGPCTGELTPAAYRRECIEGVVAFYEGRYGFIVDLLVERMKGVAAERKFERARDVLKTLKFIEQLTRQKRFFDPSGLQADVIAAATSGDASQIVRLGVRGGRIVDEESVDAESPEGLGSAITQFVVQRYAEASEAPPVLVLPPQYEESVLLKRWFADCLGKRVRILRPSRGAERRLLELAERNARQKLQLKAAA
jgi:excinuclease ABC subunit C